MSSADGLALTAETLETPTRRRRELAVAVQPFAHFLAGLEERNALLIDRDMRAGARIAAGAGGTMLDRECAETAQLDPVAARQGSHDLIEDRVHNILDIPLIEMRVVLGDALNKFGFDHRDWDPGTCGYCISVKMP